MYHKSLPAVYASGKQEGQQAFVQIANESIGHPADEKNSAGETVKETALRIKQNDFVFPQFGPRPTTEDVKDKEGKVIGQREVPLTTEQAREGIEEAIKDAGGEVQFLSIHNDNTRDQAVKEAKAYIRTFEGAKDGSTNVADVVLAGLKKALEFTWKAAEKITVSQFREEVRKVQAVDIDKLYEQDPAEVLKMMKELLAKA